MRMADSRKSFSRTSVIILVVAAVAITGIVVFKRAAERNSLARQIADLSPRGAPPATVADLRKAISLYEKKIDEHVRDAAQVGVYWKILGSRLMSDKKMYGEALEALENAARYYPEDETVHYLIGMCAGTLAKSEYFTQTQEAEHFRVAEAAYKRAVEIVPRYAKALYGLSVLYVFELGRAEEAIPLMETFLDINKSDTDGMFVLARAYYAAGEYEKSIELYERIAGITKNKEVKANAESLKQQVMEIWYR
jgi:tetratricopeptide (TPR) repeat protein